MLLPLEAQAGQLQGGVQAHGALELAHFGEALLEVEVGHRGQQAVQAVQLPFLLQLAAVVIAPARPARQARAVMAEPALEGLPDLGQVRRAIHVSLADMGELAAESGQAGAPEGAHEALEMVHLVAIGTHQGGTDLDDFHFFQRPATFFGGGFQVYHQPVRHAVLLGGGRWPAWSEYGGAFAGRQTAC
ncbi:hypothetical protein D3C72_1513720 [compost metagenome]